MTELILIEETGFPIVKKLGLGVCSDRFITFQEEVVDGQSSIHARIQFLQPLHWQWIQIIVAELQKSQVARKTIQEDFETKFGFGGYRLPVEDSILTEDCIRFWLREEIRRPNSDFSWGEGLEEFDPTRQSFHEWFAQFKKRQPRRLTIGQTAKGIDSFESASGE